jgi:hypothetical protein
VKLTISNWSGAALCYAISVVLSGTLICAASTGTVAIPGNEKVKVTSLIVSRNGDTFRIKDKKSGQFVVVNITDSTKIERKRGRLQFFRHTDMDVTAMVPGLAIEVEGRGDVEGRLEAEKISFSPDEFAVEVTEHQEVMANRKAENEAVSRAQQGIAAAAQAQSSADQAMASWAGRLVDPLKGRCVPEGIGSVSYNPFCMARGVDHGFGFAFCFVFSQ